jgi:hypothetical protein
VKRTFGRPSSRWEENIEMHFRGTEYEDVNWINLAQDRFHWRAFTEMGSIKAVNFSTRSIIVYLEERPYTVQLVDFNDVVV